MEQEVACFEAPGNAIGSKLLRKWGWGHMGASVSLPTQKDKGGLGFRPERHSRKGSPEKIAPIEETVDQDSVRFDSTSHTKQPETVLLRAYRELDAIVESARHDMVFSTSERVSHLQVLLYEERGRLQRLLDSSEGETLSHRERDDLFSLVALYDVFSSLSITNHATELQRLYEWAWKEVPTTCTALSPDERNKQLL